MFPNLRAEMARKNIKCITLAETLGISYDSVINKINGKTEFTRVEIFKIRDTFFPDLSLEYLFGTMDESSNKQSVLLQNQWQNTKGGQAQCPERRTMISPTF
jgi:plasmid maintenance system antidote protein VapI